MDDIEFYCDNVTCTSSELDENENNITLDVDGNMGIGTVTITHDGKISFELDRGVYCAEKTVDEEKISFVIADNEEAIDYLKGYLKDAKIQITGMSFHELPDSMLEVCISAFLPHNFDMSTLLCSYRNYIKSINV